MKGKNGKWQSLAGVWVLGLLAASACRATVAGDPDKPIRIEAHVTIDVRQIKEEAHSIEEMVSGGAKPPAARPSSRVEGWLVSTAFAQEGGLSPEVLAAIESRKARFGQLKTYKGQGLIGEDSQGHVAALGGGPQVQSLTAEENRDRETIYQAQLKQKGLPQDAIGAIRAAFAEEQRERAEPGEKIQLPSGEWQTASD